MYISLISTHLCYPPEHNLELSISGRGKENSETVKRKVETGGSDEAGLSPEKSSRFSGGGLSVERISSSQPLQ